MRGVSLGNPGIDADAVLIRGKQMWPGERARPKVHLPERLITLTGQAVVRLT